MNNEVLFLICGLVVGYLAGAATGYFVAASRHSNASRLRELALMEKLVPVSTAEPKKLLPFQMAHDPDNGVGEPRTIQSGKARSS